MHEIRLDCVRLLLEDSLGGFIDLLPGRRQFLRDFVVLQMRSLLSDSGAQLFGKDEVRGGSALGLARHALAFVPLGWPVHRRAVFCFQLLVSLELFRRRCLAFGELLRGDVVPQRSQLRGDLLHLSARKLGLWFRMNLPHHRRAMLTTEDQIRRFGAHGLFTLRLHDDRSLRFALQPMQLLQQRRRKRSLLHLILRLRRGRLRLHLLLLLLRNVIPHLRQPRRH